MGGDGRAHTAEHYGAIWCPAVLPVSVFKEKGLRAKEERDSLNRFNGRATHAQHRTPHWARHDARPQTRTTRMLLFSVSVGLSGVYRWTKATVSNAGRFNPRRTKTKRFSF